MSQKPLSQIPALSKGLHATRNLPEELEVKPVELISASFVFINTSKRDLLEPPHIHCPKIFQAPQISFSTEILFLSQKVFCPQTGWREQTRKGQSTFKYTEKYLRCLTDLSLTPCLKLSGSFNKIHLQQINIM